MVEDFKFIFTYQLPGPIAQVLALPFFFSIFSQRPLWSFFCARATVMRSNDNARRLVAADELCEAAFDDAIVARSAGAE